MTAPVGSGDRVGCSQWAAAGDRGHPCVHCVRDLPLTQERHTAAVSLVPVRRRSTVSLARQFLWLQALVVAGLGAAASGRGRPAPAVPRVPVGRRGPAAPARRFLWLQALVVAVLVAASSVVAYRDARDAVGLNAAERTTAVVESIADSPQA